jgi:hypothetical protein
MARGFNSGGQSMVIWAERGTLKYHAKWFCSCGKFFGESGAIYKTAEEALDAGEKQLTHLYEAHPGGDNKDKPLN